MGLFDGLFTKTKKKTEDKDGGWKPEATDNYDSFSKNFDNEEKSRQDKDKERENRWRDYMKKYRKDSQD
jgi:hypothetical protein